MHTTSGRIELMDARVQGLCRWQPDGR